MPRHLPLPKRNFKEWPELLPHGEQLRQFGRHIYIFRNIATNQILYALRPRVEQRTLQQLPFIGKHSVPPKVRHDLWVPHCRVGPFPTSKQGMDALKKLQELRRLNLYSWHKTNKKLADEMAEEDWADVQNPRHAVITKQPLLVMNWHKPGFLQKKRLIKLLMDYRANATADLARVLSIQRELGKERTTKRQERMKEQREWLTKKWAKLRILTQALKDGKVQELDKQIADLNVKRTAAQQQTQANEVRRINEKITFVRRKIAEMYWASRMVQRLEQKQAAIDAGLESKTEAYNQAKSELAAEGVPATQSKPGGAPQAAADGQLSRRPRKRHNTVHEQILTKDLPSLPEAWSLRGVECQWSDLVDAEHASKQWPNEIVHDTLNSATRKRELGFVTEDEYQEMFLSEKEAIDREAKAEVNRVLSEQYPDRYAPLPEKQVGLVAASATSRVPEPAKGIARFMPGFIKNRFSSGQPRV